MRASKCREVRLSYQRRCLLKCETLRKHRLTSLVVRRILLGRQVLKYLLLWCERLFFDMIILPLLHCWVSLRLGRLNESAFFIHVNSNLQQAATQVSLTENAFLAKHRKVCFELSQSLWCSHFYGPGVALIWQNILRQFDHILKPLRVPKITGLILDYGALGPSTFAGVNGRPTTNKELS